jgi:CRISPR-associated protein Cst2
MSFVTGLILINAPASALNNLGSIPGARTDNTVGVKLIRTKEGAYPYVSAQAFRYWLRTTLENGAFGWQAAPIFREKKVAYTDANPINFWDDDLFGYMRAPSKRADAVEAREASGEYAEATPTTDTVTRVSPFRVSTLVSIAPVIITEDFGVMSRHEGDPVPHEHQFYRTTLKGLLSLDLHACGTFSYRQKTGYRNLDDERVKLAQEQGLTPLDHEPAYRLPAEARLQRVTTLFEGLAHLEGGAKQTIHYTDVTPALVILAVTKGGNHIFGHVVGANGKGQPTLKTEALAEALTVFADDILSPVYVGWVKGYLDEERAKLEDFAQMEVGQAIQISHPREAYQALIEAMQKNPTWLD